MLARVPDAPPGTKGISCFIVPKFLVDDDGSLGERNGVTACRSSTRWASTPARPACSRYDDAVGYLVGEPNQGMRYMFTMMNTRAAVGRAAGPGGGGAAPTSRRWPTPASGAQGRAVGAPAGPASPIIEHPDVRRMLLTMRAHIEAMRALLYLNAEASTSPGTHPDADGAAARARSWSTC